MRRRPTWPRSGGWRRERGSIRSRSPRPRETLRRPLRAHGARHGGPRRRDRVGDRAERRGQEHAVQHDHRALRPRRRRRVVRGAEHRGAQALADHPTRHLPDVPDRPPVPEHDGAGERHGRPALPLAVRGIGRGPAAAQATERGGASPWEGPGGPFLLRSAPLRLADGWHEPHRDAGAHRPDLAAAEGPRRDHPGDRARHARRQRRLRPGDRPGLREEDRRGHVRGGRPRRTGDRGVPRDEGVGMSENGRAPLLELRNVSTHYGLVAVLRDVDMEIFGGEMVCLLGGNASGKTTTLKTILGYVTPSEGQVVLDGEVVSGLSTTEVVKRGVSMVPENRRLFPDMTVDENLQLGAYLRKDRRGVEEVRSVVLETFPRIRERLKQKAGTLSGGEQQMVAMGRALMADPKVLLMDEPSMGLAPILVEQVFQIIKKIRELGKTVFVVEQNANMALSIADRGYVLQTGQVVLADTAESLLNNPLMREAYLGEL